MTGMIKAAALWHKTSPKGSEYWVGRLGGVQVVVMANTKRESDKDPTHHLFFGEIAEKLRLGSQERPSDETAVKMPAPDGARHWNYPKHHQTKPGRPEAAAGGA